VSANETKAINSSSAARKEQRREKANTSENTPAANMSDCVPLGKKNRWAGKPKDFVTRVIELGLTAASAHCAETARKSLVICELRCVNRRDGDHAEWGQGACLASPPAYVSDARMAELKRPVQKPHRIGNSPFLICTVETLANLVSWRRRFWPGRGGARPASGAGARRRIQMTIRF